MNLGARECPLSFNLVGVYQTLRYMPAVAAGVTDELWSVKNLCGQSDDGKTVVRRGRSGVRSLVYRLRYLCDSWDRTDIWRPIDE